MKRTKEISAALNRNPDHELVFMYPSYEGSEHAYTLGYPSKVETEEYWTDDERVWFKYKDECELRDHYGEIIAEDMYDKFPITDEQERVVDKKTEEFINSRQWKKCICVFIDY